MSRVSYKHYLLGLLTVLLLFNYVDRLALSIMLQDIKVELELADTQLGLLTGFAFAVFYSLMGVPIARWADRGNRVTIISVTALLWSAAVACCGLASSFIQLLLIRVGVAVGEAGCIPPASSLIADYFSRAERPSAMAAYYGFGDGCSLIVGYFLAGWLNEFYGWRATFLLLGTPGLVLAALAWFTLKEPRSKNSGKSSYQTVSDAGAVAAPVPSLKQVCATLWANTTFRHLMLGLSLLFFFNYGMGLWVPSFFARSYGLTSGAIGTWMAVAWALGALLGTYIGSSLASRYAARNESLQLKAAAAAIVLSGSSLVLVCLSSNAYIAFLLMGVVSVGLNTSNGPVFGTIQTLVPHRMRALATAIIYLFANLIGMGFGPLATGALSDLYSAWAGQESLRYAILSLSPGFIWTAWHVWQASATVTRDIGVQQRYDEKLSSDARVTCTL